MSDKTPSQSDSKSLEQLFVDFAELVLTRMELRAPAEGVPRYSEGTNYFKEGGGRSYGHKEKVDSSTLLNEHDYNLIYESAEAERCAKKHLAEGILRLPKLSDTAENPILTPTWEQIRPPLIHDLLGPVRDVLERYGEFRPSHEHIIESYRRFKAEWIATEFRWDVTIPLLNFKSDLQHARIGTVFELGPFVPKEKASLWEMSHFFWDTMSFMVWRDTEFRLAGSYTLGRDEPHCSGDTDVEAGLLITALRLFKAGDVGTVGAFLNSKAVSLVFRSGFRSFYDYQVPVSCNTYTLNKSKLPRVLLLFDSLKEKDARGHLKDLKVALRRFNQAYSRKAGEDKIIDLTIALESSLLSGIQEELKYRLSVRGAALLAGSRDSQETQSLLKVTYDARSSIVHMGKELSELSNKTGSVIPPLQPHELPKRCEDIVRDILKEYIARLTKGQTIKEINDELDRRIVEGLA